MKCRKRRKSLRTPESRSSTKMGQRPGVLDALCNIPTPNKRTLSNATKTKPLYQTYSGIGSNYAFIFGFSEKTRSLRLESERGNSWSSKSHEIATMLQKHSPTKISSKLRCFLKCIEQIMLSLPETRFRVSQLREFNSSCKLSSELCVDTSRGTRA